MKICILHIGHRDPNEPSKHPPSPDRFRGALAPHLPQAEWTVISAVTDTLPAIDTFDAYLITGGKYSVFEDLDWQDTLFEFIRALHAAAKPLIGICYGHQAIAHALGGEVSRSDKGWGVGLMPVDVVADTGWAARAQSVSLHAMHQDQVTALPDGARVFLSSAFCPISGFTLGDHFLAIQQHPDFTPELNADLIHRRADRMGAAAEAGLTSLSGRDDTAVSVQWMSGFLEEAVRAH
ncbi:MAG: type 1 glutamine amidotransferase [Pseudomonadota bacterium]